MSARVAPGGSSTAAGLAAAPGVLALLLAVCSGLLGWPIWLAWPCIALYAIAQAALLRSLVRRA